LSPGGPTVLKRTCYTYIRRPLSDFRSRKECDFPEWVFFAVLCSVRYSSVTQSDAAISNATKHREEKKYGAKLSFAWWSRNVSVDSVLPVCSGNGVWACWER